MKESLPAFMTDPNHEYYVRPDVFTKKAKLPDIRTEERMCRFCRSSFIAKWRSGKGPQHCSEACIKAKAAKDHKAWATKNIDRYRELGRKSKKRTIKRSYTRKISVNPNPKEV